MLAGCPRSGRAESHSLHQSLSHRPEALQYFAEHAVGGIAVTGGPSSLLMLKRALRSFWRRSCVSFAEIGPPAAGDFQPVSSR